MKDFLLYYPVPRNLLIVCSTMIVIGILFDIIYFYIARFGMEGRKNREEETEPESNRYVSEKENYNTEDTFMRFIGRWRATVDIGQGTPSDSQTGDESKNNDTNNRSNCDTSLKTMRDHFSAFSHESGGGVGDEKRDGDMKDGDRFVDVSKVEWEALQAEIESLNETVKTMLYVKNTANSVDHRASREHTKAPPFTETTF